MNLRAHLLVLYLCVSIAEGGRFKQKYKIGGQITGSLAGRYSGVIYKKKTDCIGVCTRDGCDGFAVSEDGSQCIQETCKNRLPSNHLWTVHKHDKARGERKFYLLRNIEIP